MNGWVFRTLNKQATLIIWQALPALHLLCPSRYVVGMIQNALLSLEAKVENRIQNISAF